MAAHSSPETPYRIAQHRVRAPYTRLWLWRAAACILAVALFTGTSAALVARDIDSSIQHGNVDEILHREPSDSYSGRAVNILVIGSDTRKGEGNMIDDTEDTAERSDTTMIVHIAADRSRASIVSIPRDTMVQIPSCTRADGSKVPSQYAQFNWAYAYGGADGSRDSAVACTLTTVESVTGLHIDDYVVVDFNGFTHMIDALGGINVYVDRAVDDENTDLTLDVGCYPMDGATALQYARLRHGVAGGDGSDLQRIERQHHVMSVMLRKALSLNLATDTATLYEFLKAGLSSVTMSPSLGTVSTLTGLVYSLRNLKPENVTFLEAPVTQDPRNPNRVVFVDKATGVWAALASDASLPGGLDARNANGDEFTTPDPAAAAATESPNANASETATAATPSVDPSASAEAGADPSASTEASADPRLTCEP